MSSARKATARTKQKRADSEQNGTSTSKAKKIKAASPIKMPRKPRGMVKLNEGEIITDLFKKQWRVGNLLSWGGFGAIHYASRNTGAAVSSNAEYVVKIEPHSNGPLFCELSFYMRAAKSDSISSWVQSHKLKHLGVPPYIASGSLDKDGKKYRFMVMDRFAEDVEMVFRNHGKQFSLATVLQLGLRLTDCLEYIHNQGYVHADIKGLNLMLGYGKSKQGQIYLVDYGLAHRFSCEDNHKAYKEDPKRRHDGTIEYTSIDAHKGVAPSCRGDLEILGYCMLHWASGRLPWIDNLADKEYVQAQKIRHMANIPKFVKECLKDPTGKLTEFLQLVSKLEYDELPNYSAIRKIFKDGLDKLGGKDDGKTVTFKSADGSVSSPSADDASDDSESSPSPIKKPKRRNKETAEEGSPKKKRKVAQTNGPATRRSPRRRAAVKPKK